MPATLPPPGAEDALYLVDLSGYVFRAYHAIAPLTNSKGEPTNATLGTTNMLQKIVDVRKPAYFAVAMDSRTRTFRKDVDPRYKANRPAAPVDLQQQMQRCEEIVRGYAIPVFQEDGLEADDLIACVVQRALAEGLRVVLASADKDLMQLVQDDDERVVLWDTMRDRVYGPEEVHAKFGVAPSKLRDLLALTGDTSDNVPGVRSVGPKTAADLLNQYGTLDGIYANLESIKRIKLKEALETHRDDAFISQRLVTLRADCNIDWDRDRLAYGGADVEALKVLFTDLEFNRLLHNLDRGGPPLEVAGGSPPPASKRPSKKPEPKEHAPLPEVTVQVVGTEADLVRLANEARARKQLAIAVFADKPEPTSQTPLAFSLAYEPGTAFYVPVGHRYLGVPDQLDFATVERVLSPLLHDASITTIAYDVKSTEVLFRREEQDSRQRPAGTLFDLHVAAYLVDESAPNTFDELLQRELGARAGALPPAPKKGLLPLDQLEVERAAELLGPDAARMLLLADRLREGLEAGGVAELARDVEFPLVHVLADLETEGVLVDTSTLGTLGARFSEEMALLEAKAKELAGRDFSLRSRDQLEAILFDELKLPSKKKTPKGGRSTDHAVLDELVELHELPGVILEYRELDKLKGTYVDALPRYVNPRTGRIHTRFWQTVAATGRLSSSDPNLQNIPIRSALGREIRKAFVAPPGAQIVSCDYSQIELRIMAHLADDAVLGRAFSEAVDVHEYTASLVFEVPREQVTREMRGRAKTINFGVLYGMGEMRLARSLGISRAEAGEFIGAYFERYAGVRRFLSRTVDEARRGEGVRTLLGRRRYLPNLASPNRMLRMEAERIAKNTPIQGTAADILKLAMLRLREPVTPSAKMVLTVHDELVFEVPLEERDRIESLVRDVMQSVIELRVPLVVDLGFGPTWAEAK